MHNEPGYEVPWPHCPGTQLLDLHAGATSFAIRPDWRVHTWSHAGLEEKSLHKPVSGSYGAFSRWRISPRLGMFPIVNYELTLLRTATNAP